MGWATIRARAALILLVVLAGCGGDDAAEEHSTDYQSLASAVEQLGFRYEEATDTAVRHDVLVATYCSVVHGEPVPSDFGMFSPEGDRAVQSRVNDFVLRAREALSGLTEEERIEAVWGADWGENVYLQPSDCKIRP